MALKQVQKMNRLINNHIDSRKCSNRCIHSSIYFLNFLYPFWARSVAGALTATVGRRGNTPLTGRQCLQAHTTSNTHTHVPSYSYFLSSTKPWSLISESERKLEGLEKTHIWSADHYTTMQPSNGPIWWTNYIKRQWLPLLCYETEDSFTKMIVLKKLQLKISHVPVVIIFTTVNNIANHLDNAKK